MVLRTTMAPTSSALTAFLALAAASPYCDAFAFTPGPRVQQRPVVQLSASTQDENVVVDGLRKVTGGAAAFLTGMGIMAQVAMADPNAIAPLDEAIAQAQSSAQTSNIVLSAGAPSFGGGGSFETLDFSLPSYDQATSGGDLTKPSSSPSPSAPSVDEDAAAKAAAKEEAKRAAEEEKAAKKQAEAEAKEAKKQAEAEAKAAAEKEAAEKQAKKEAAEKAKEERKAAEKEKQRQMVERQKAAKEEEEAAAPAVSLDALKDIKAPDIQVPDIKIPEIKAPAMPSFSMPKIDIPDMPKVDIPAPPKIDAPKPAAPEIKIPDAPKFDMPKVDAPKMPDMKSFSLPKVDIPDMPKVDIPAPSKPSYNLDTPSFEMPTKSSSAPVFDENLEPQEVRDERAATKNAAFKDAQAEAKEAEKAAKIAQNKANEAKKAFKEAKGEACKTRPGGKLLCLRGFGVGY